MLGERRPGAMAANAAEDAIEAPSVSGVPRVSGAPAASVCVWRDPVAWTVAALVFGGYFAISLFRLLQLTPASWDLGIYTEYVKQLSLLHAPIVDVRGPGFNLLGDHFQIGVAVLAPFFRVFPSPATLLFFQALFVAVSVFPVMSAGNAALGRASGRLIGFAYGFSWGLQQMIDFDFHEIALAVPLLAFSLSALVRGRVDGGVDGEARGRVRAVALWALPLVFVKEDQGFTVAAIGVLLVFSGIYAPPQRMRGSVGWGALLVVWGLTWSVLAITVIIPHFNAAHDYYYWKDGGVVGAHGFSAGALATQAASGWPTKLQTVVMLLLPTAFAALGSPLALVGLPSLALRFISTNTAYWGTNWHYNATLMPILFIAAIEAMWRWRAAADPGPVRAGLARHGAPMMAAIAVALAFQFPLNSLWHGSTYVVSPHVAADNAAMAVVPDGATVVTTLDLLAPLAARTDTFWIGNSGNPLAEYIVFDGSDSGYDPAPTNVPAFINQLDPGAGYTQIFARDHVYVFRR